MPRDFKKENRRTFVRHFFSEVCLSDGAPYFILSDVEEYIKEQVAERPSMADVYDRNRFASALLFMAFAMKGWSREVYKEITTGVLAEKDMCLPSDVYELHYGEVIFSRAAEICRRKLKEMQEAAVPK